jgi:hypothetical protein
MIIIHHLAAMARAFLRGLGEKLFSRGAMR